MRQTPVHVGDSLKKLATKDKSRPLGSQRVRPKSEQPGVTRLRYFIV
jgi:hypothetical protein